jgi:hypothetical protein
MEFSKFRGSNPEFKLFSRDIFDSLFFFIFFLFNKFKTKNRPNFTSQFPASKLQKKIPMKNLVYTKLKMAMNL